MKYSKARLKAGIFLGKLGRFLQSLTVIVLRPPELIELGRRTYRRPENIVSWSCEARVDAGLDELEKELLQSIPMQKGNLLLLGLGGGRDAIALAKIGFKVTGIDYIPEMVEQAVQNGQKRGVTIKGLVQELTNLDIPPQSFDIIWASTAMYSIIPTKMLRVSVLRRIAKILKAEGYFICGFQLGTSPVYLSKIERVRRLISKITFGNRWYEKGDHVWNEKEFVHEFPSRDLLISEFVEGGFHIENFLTPGGASRGGVVLKIHHHDGILEADVFPHSSTRKR